MCFKPDTTDFVNQIDFEVLKWICEFRDDRGCFVKQDSLLTLTKSIGYIHAYVYIIYIE